MPDRRIVALASLALLALHVPPAAAVEYRLQVANVRDEAFTSFLTAVSTRATSRRPSCSTTGICSRRPSPWPAHTAACPCAST
jgi:hypothetical protein